MKKSYFGYTAMLKLLRSQNHQMQGKFIQSLFIISGNYPVHPICKNQSIDLQEGGGSGSVSHFLQDTIFSLKGCECFYVAIKMELFFFFLRAALEAYGSSQDRGSNQSCSCQPMPQPQQCWIPYPLRKPRDQTSILIDTSWIPFPSVTMGTARALESRSFL